MTNNPESPFQDQESTSAKSKEQTPESSPTPDADIAHGRAGQHPMAEPTYQEIVGAMADKLWERIGPAILGDHKEHPNAGGL